VYAGQACQFAADDLEDFRGAEAGDEQAQQPRCRSGVGTLADERARASAAFDEALVLQVTQCARDGGPRDAEAANQLRLAWQTAGWRVSAGGDVGAQLARDVAVFRRLGHG